MQKTIMIIEDDFETQFLFTEFLRAEDFNVIPCTHGKEALDYLSKNQAPNLIVMDLSLPFMTADEFVQDLRKEEKLADVPLIVVSGKTDIADHAQRLKAKTYVRKPFDIDKVIALIHSHA